MALEAQIEPTIRTGPATLDNVRAVLVNVDGETKIAHYRQGFTEDDYLHVFSVTKSVLSILIGIAIADGLIAGLDQPLSELLPDHRPAMSDATAQTTLRQLMTMSGGFDDYWPMGDAWERPAKRGGDYVDLLLSGRSTRRGLAFWYSNPSAHLVAAVLAAALERAAGDNPRAVLDYAREKLFDPLGISTRKGVLRPAPRLLRARVRQGRIRLGNRPRWHPARRVRSAAEGARHAEDRGALPAGGVWNGQQIVPADWVQQSTAPSIRNDEYGLLWWIIDRTRRGWVRRQRVRRAVGCRVARSACGHRLLVGRTGRRSG